MQCGLSAIKRTNEQIRISTCIEIVKGMASPEVKRKGYDKLKTFGVGHDITLTQWQDYLLQMLQIGLIEIAYDEGQHAKITSSGDAVLYGRKTAELSIVDHSAKEAGSVRQKSRLQLRIPEVGKPGSPTIVQAQESPELFEQLRKLRMECANEEGFPPYIVFSDKTLHALATLQPTTLEAFSNIIGVGEHKKQKYGQRFVSLIRRFNRL